MSEYYREREIGPLRILLVGELLQIELGPAPAPIFFKHNPYRPSSTVIRLGSFRIAWQHEFETGGHWVRMFHTDIQLGQRRLRYEGKPRGPKPLVP